MLPYVRRCQVGRLVVRLVVSRRRWPSAVGRPNHELEVLVAVELRGR